MKPKSNIFDTVVFVALAASGKSEAITFIKRMPPEMRRDLHFGQEIVILDDFPYVDLMRSIDEAFVQLEEKPVFFPDPKKLFLEPEISWKLLIFFLNEDIEQIILRQEEMPVQSIEKALLRFDRARKELKTRPLFFTYDERPFIGKAKCLELGMNQSLQEKINRIIQARNAQIPKNPQETTVLVEFARGGEYGAPMPLPWGYEDSFRSLSPAILKSAVFLYLKVFPEQAALKNFLRADPNDPSGILGHCVPYEVMYRNYGSDDFEYLLLSKHSLGGRCIRVEPPISISDWQEFFVPAAILDNTKDFTSFVREYKDKDFKDWPNDKKTALYESLKRACDELWEMHSRRLPM